jgi:hypothetical protein
MVSWCGTRFLPKERRHLDVRAGRAHGARGRRQPEGLQQRRRLAQRAVVEDVLGLRAGGVGQAARHGAEEARHRLLAAGHAVRRAVGQRRDLEQRGAEEPAEGGACEVARGRPARRPQQPPDQHRPPAVELGEEVGLRGYHHNPHRSR